MPPTVVPVAPKDGDAVSMGPGALRRLEVGVNYAWPWNKFGVYFGSGEHHPSENPEYDVWLDNLERNLDFLKEVLSVHVVRIFLFGNAWNFGQVVPNRKMPSGWEFQLPASLHPAYSSQLERMLQAFDVRGMQVIPSLLSFEALAIWDSQGGRGEIASDPIKRERFFDMVLEPFLEISTRYRAAIRAWEVMNEPGQVTDSFKTRFFTARKTDHPISAADMRTFLGQAIDLIEGQGFASTVGHWVRGDMEWLPTGSKRQFHHYPQKIPLLRRALPSFAETQAFVGEFAADERPPEQTRSILWPDIPNEDPSDGAVRTFRRLKLLEEKGYELALLWPNLTQDYDPADPSVDPVHFTDDVQRGIAAFQRGTVP